MLKGELKIRKLTQKQFAEAVSMVQSHVSEIASNKRAITPPVAMKFQEFFDIPAIDWLELQTKFRFSNTEDAEELRATEELQKYDDFISLKTLFSRGGGVRMTSSKKKLEILRDEFGITSSKQLQNYFGFFKKSDKTGQDVRMLNTWTFLARKESRQCIVKGKFDSNKLDEIGGELSCIFHENENTIMRTANALSRYGIGFCVVKKVDHASVDGFSFLEKGIPYIVVTKRFDRIDNLAFTVLHELYHVCRHMTKEGDQRINIDGYSSETQKEEYEANRFAAKTLIPDDLWLEAPEVRLVPQTIQRAYTKWAKEHKLNKWIVLGRVAHDLGVYQLTLDPQRSIN